jgi:hypothetical protein
LIHLRHKFKKINMKFFSSLIIAALCVTVFFSSCQNDSTATKEGAADTQQGAQSGASVPVPSVDPVPMPTPSIITDPTAIPGVTAPGAATPAPKAEPPQNAKGVWHYTCSKGCAGGGGSAAPCAKCGTVLAHNTKYHGDVPTPAPSTSVTPGANQTVAAPPTPKPEPPQNAKGVWHYTCADGCAGGGGAIAPCTKCSKPLAHNPVYHQ